MRKPSPRYDIGRDMIIGGDPRLDVFRGRLWSHGIKATEARLEVLYQFAKISQAKVVEPVSATELAKRLEGRFAVATLYRAVEVLAKVGLIKKVESKEGFATFLPM